MYCGVSSNTILRSMECIRKGNALKDGADHLKDNPLRDFIVWANSLINVQTEEKIKRKEGLLARCSWQITAQIINAKLNTYGYYECTIYAGHQSFTLRESAHSPDEIEINEKKAPDEIKTLLVQFIELKKLLLERFIKEHLSDPEPVNLSGLDLTDINLENVDFHNTALAIDNLKAVIKNKGDLSGASLVGNINIAEFSSLSFKGVKLDRHNLSQLILVQMMLSESGLQNKEMLYGVNFDGQDLTGLSLSNVDFTEANFTDTRCDGANFNAASLTKANLTNASFKGASLIEANLSGIKSNNQTNFINSNLHGVEQVTQLLPGRNLTGIRLSIDQVIDIAKTKTNHRDFTGVVLSYGNRHNKDSIQKKFMHFTFNNAKLAGIDFCGADLTDVKLIDADLSSALFDHETQLTDADLTNANLMGVDLSAVRIDASTKIAGIQLEGAKLSKAWVEAARDQHVNLDGANLEGVDLAGLDLSHLSLTDAKLTGAILTGTSLNRSGLEAALKTRSCPEDDGRSVDLKGLKLCGNDTEHPLDLSGIDFSHVDLSESIFKYCNIDNTNLLNANLSGVNLDSTSLISVTDGDTVIVRDSDCVAYEDQFKRRLNAILKGADLESEKGKLPAHTLSPNSILTLKKSVFFPLSHDYSLTRGLTNEDGGAQDLFLYAGLDIRTFSSELSEPQRTAQEKTITKRLLENGFTDAQKTLFHWSRSALWATLKVPYYLLLEQKIDVTQCATEQTLSQIYTTSRPNNTRVKEALMQTCFDAIADSPNFKKKFPEIREQEKRMVAELFLSKAYKW